MDKMSVLLKRSWWALLLRGIFAVIFGIAAFVMPEMTAGLLAIIFGVAAVLEGIVLVVESLLNRFDRWWLSLIGGLISIVAGGFAFLWPGMVVTIVIYIIAAKAFLVGLMEIMVAIRIKQFMQNEWMLTLAGVISIIFSIILFVKPQIGIIAIVSLIAIFALFFGIIMIFLAIKARAMGAELEKQGV